MSNLVRHAQEELARAHLFDKEGEHDLYGGMIGEAVLELVDTFAKQGHSGLSASITLAIFQKVAMFEALSPLTDDPREWQEVGEGMWQNRRQSDAFSTNAGRTYYRLGEQRRLYKRLPRKFQRRFYQTWVAYPVHKSVSV